MATLTCQDLTGKFMTYLAGGDFRLVYDSKLLNVTEEKSSFCVLKRLYGLSLEGGDIYLSVDTRVFVPRAFDSVLQQQIDLLLQKGEEVPDRQIGDAYKIYRFARDIFTEAIAEKTLITLVKAPSDLKKDKISP